MARTTAAGKLARYRTRLDESKRWRKDEGYDDMWGRLIDLYAGKQFDGMSTSDRVAVNIAFSTVNVIYPSTTINHPKINLTARDPEGNDKAVIAEAVMDYLWKNDEIAAGDEFRLAVKDFLTVGHGWVKTGWRYSEGVRERSPEAIESEAESQLAELDEAATAAPHLAGDMPTDGDVMAGISTTEQYVLEDRVFVERVSPFDMFVDPEATTVRNMKWIAQKVVRTVDEVRADPRYDSRARRVAQSDSSTKYGHDDSRRGHKRSTDIERITVWEFYDLAEKTMCVFAAQGEGYLVKPTPIPYVTGIPFVMIRNYEVPDQFYPMGDLEAIEPLQHELNRTRSQLQNARKTYVRKYLADEAFLSPTARASLASTVDGEVVGINTNNGQVRLDQVIVPAPINQLPADLFSYGEMVQADMQQVSGVSEYQRGGGGDIRRTATEASMIQDAVNARSADKLATVEKSIARVGKNMLELTRQYLTGEHVARIVGNHGKPIWVSYTQQDIDVEADFHIEGGSTTPKNEAFKQDQAMKLLGALGPLVGQVVDPAQLARYVLNAFGITAEKFLMEPPPPMGPGGPGGPPGPGGPGEDSPDAMPPGMPMPDAPPPEVMPPDPVGDGGIPPEVMAQLQGQIGLTL